MGRGQQSTSKDTTNTNDQNTATAQTGNTRQNQVGNQAIQDELNLNRGRDEANQAISNWFSETVGHVNSNATAMQNAMARLINFEEGAGSEFANIAGIAGGALALPFFGTVGAVVGFCVAALGVISGLSGPTAKIAAATRKVTDARDRARGDSVQYRNNAQAAVRNAADIDTLRQVRQVSIDNLPAVEEVDENIVYRDLLIEYARGGGFNLTGSAWNVRNMSVFGDAPWYHSWDWGSPGWTNGRDVAEELNSLAEGDPTTRRNVRVN